MRTILVFALSGLFLGIVGCGNALAPAPTPIIIVVTATPDALPGTPATGASVTPRATTAGGATPNATGDATLNLKPTDVKYVLAKQDINIRNGPGTDFDIVGGVFAGQTAQVTGYKSADDLWWRVVCPTDAATDCWVSADPGLTEASEGPSTDTTPTATPSSEAQVEKFVRTLAASIQAKDYDALAETMNDPFAIGYWRSEGTSPSRAEALGLLQNSWLGPANNPVVDLADKTDQTKLLEGTNPLTMWGPQAKVVKSVYAEGLGATGNDQALLIIGQRDDKTLYWHGLLYAAGGFH